VNVVLMTTIGTHDIKFWRHVDPPFITGDKTQ
jgi:hypothetical protein